MRRQTPLIYLHGTVQGLYDAAWIVGCRAEENDRIGAPAAGQFNDPAAPTARPLTSSLTAIPWGSRSFPTASRSASSTTPP